MTNRIIFLDIDGVLIHDLSSINHWEANKVEDEEVKKELLEEYPCEMDLECVALLKQLQEEFQFKIVVSSSIRKLHNSLESIQEAFKGSKFNELDFHEDWKTKSTATIYQGSKESLNHWCVKMNAEVDEVAEITRYWRGHDITEWLRRHPEVIQYVSIDDSADFYPLEIDNCLHVHRGLSKGGLKYLGEDNIRKQLSKVFN